MRVLLVEDDPGLGRDVAEYLRRNGFAVDLARTAADAMTLSGRGPYDAAVVDLGLPDADGMTVATHLGRLAPAPRIILATARDAVDDRVTGLDAGADDYLVKPYALPELVARLRALLRRPAEVVPTVLHVEDLELDTATRVARRAGHTIALTAKEYAVLELLMRRAGTVVTRDSIATHAWDDNYDPLSNVIDVYVARLRRKIDLDGLEPLIVTLRGAGYRLGPHAPYPARR